MRLRIQHQTTYRYDPPITYSIQSLRLTPRSHDGQTVLRWSLRADQRSDLPAIEDGLGNLCHVASRYGSHGETTILAEGEVDTSDTGGIVTGTREKVPPLYFLRETPLTALGPGIGELAESVRHHAGRERLQELMHAVRRRIDFVPGATDPATSAAEALALGRGVCQDHTHVFVAAARHLGIPARYVSGYLATPAPAEAAVASHAWAEAHLEGVGWLAFDAANDVHPDELYVRLGSGLDYHAAAPVLGMRHGEARESLAVRVRVQQADRAQ